MPRNEPETPMPPDILAKRRNCTDIICLILFVVFVLIQVLVSYFAFMCGDPQRLMTPRDSNGQYCSGSTPNLLYFNLLTCLDVTSALTGCSTPQICVSQCPNQSLYFPIAADAKILLNNYCITAKVQAYFNGTIPIIVSPSDYTQLVLKNICPTFLLSQKPIFNRCLPSLITDAVAIAKNLTAYDSSTNMTYEILDLTTNQYVSGTTMNKAVSYITNFLNIQTVGQFLLQDFVNAVYLILILLSIGAVVSFIYILITRWIVGPIIWLSLLGIIGLLAYAVYFCINRYFLFQNNTESTQTFQFTTNYNYYLQLSSTWLAFGILAAIVLVIVLLITLVLCKRLRLAIGLIEEASKAVTGVMFVLVWPIVPFLLQVGFMAFNIAVAVYLATSGKDLYRITCAYGNTSNCTNNATFKIGDSCTPATFNNQSQNVSCTFYRYGYGDPFNSAESSEVIKFLSNYEWLPQLYNLFMLYWFQAFIVGFNQMVLAGCFAIWYWSESKKCCIALSSVKDTLVYHLGSIAFGSLLISIVKIIRAIIQFVENRVKSATGNNAATNCCITFLACCCKCCFWCLEKFLQFLSRNAYIMVAIYGRNFCSSAKDALTLLASNALRALVLDRVTDFILFLGKLLVTVGIAILGFAFFTKQFKISPQYAKYLEPDLHYYWIPLIVVIIGTYIIAKTFFTVFEMAVDTIFLCAMKDLSINDGSPAKPYFMSKELRKLLSVKNVERSAKGSRSKKSKKIGVENPVFSVEDVNQSTPIPSLAYTNQRYEHHDKFQNYQ
jgi:choline transporter-like protein 2/4/5